MLRKLSTFLFLGFFGLISPVFCQPVLQNSAPVYWGDGKNWTVYNYPDEDMCEMASRTHLGNHFTFAYFPKKKQFGIVFTNSSAKSLQDGSTVKLLIVLKKGQELNLDWGEKEFEITKSDEQIAFMTMLSFPIDRDLAANNIISLFRKDAVGDPVIVSYVNLDGSANAIKHLFECALLASESDPNDPFLK
jgi:hypothetical protein